MERAVTVARTNLADRENHVNRLRVPQFGIGSLVLCTDTASSRPYLQPGVAPVESAGSDAFHFAPEKESVRIEYLLDDPGALVSEAKLELFTRHRKDPLWTLDLGQLGESWLSHGAHRVRWDGRIGKEKALPGSWADQRTSHDLTALDVDATTQPLPDGFVTIEHSPFKLKLTAKSKLLPGSDAVAWTYFQIVADKVELEFGPAEVLPAPVAGKGDHRAVLADLVARQPKPPDAATGGAVKLFLESDIYRGKDGSGQDTQMFDNALFTAYQTLWEEGPRLPIFAKVTIRSSSDAGVEAPKALGNVKFLWEWESASEAVSTGQHSDKFVNNAQNFHVKATKPKGQNCHGDRGGKRGGGAKAVFPDEAGYAPQDALDVGRFPFRVEKVPDKRVWAAYSSAWREKALAGKTGVLFQPSRMAGDAYKVSVYLAWDVDKDGKNALDVDDDKLVVGGAKQVSASTGNFQIWRRTHLRKFLAKTAAGMPAVSIATVCGAFRDAFLELKDVSGRRQTVAPLDWNTALTNAIAGWGDVDKLLIDAAVDQHTAGATGVLVRTRAAFATALKIKRIKDKLVGDGVDAAKADSIAAAAGAAATGAVAESTALGRAQALGFTAPKDAEIGADAGSEWEEAARWMRNPANKLATVNTYADFIGNKAIDVVKKIFDPLFDADPGVTIFQVESAHNLVADQTNGYTIGMATLFPSVAASPTTSRAAFLLMCPDGAVECGIDKISAHEIGHHFYLPHPKDTAEKKDYAAHDPIVPSKCLMSYNYDLAMHLCGFCQLRLRGWDKSALKPDASANKSA